MSDAYSGLYDNAVGIAIGTKQEEIEIVKTERELLTDLKDQLEAVADEAKVVVNPSTADTMEITVKAKTVTEELEILMAMDRIKGDLTFDDDAGCFVANLEHDYTL